MNLDIKDEKVNRLLQRTELYCVIEGSKTPSRKEIVEHIAAKKGVDEKMVVVDRIDQKYGQHSAHAYVKVYESEKAAKSIENKHKIERQEKAMKPKEKAGEEKNEAPPEEKPEEGAAEGDKAKEKPEEGDKAEEAPAEEKKEE